MSTPTLIVHGFETSNNMKVRVALGFKQLAYEFRTIDPTDREEIVRISGQHLTPVLQDGDVVVFDSAAILRYLDARFRDTPRLFGRSVQEQWAIEDWELFARTRLAGPMMEVVHTKIAGGTVDDAMQRRCAERFHGATEELAAALGSRPWLVGDALTAADITAAPVVRRVHAAGLFPPGPAAERLAGWVERVLAHDGRGRR